MIKLTKDTFQELIYDFKETKTWKYKGDKPCIIDFYADWCAPCKLLTPTLASIGEENPDITIYKIDVDNEPELAQMFSIRSIPSVLFVAVDGEPQMTTGNISKDKINEIIKNNF